METRDPNKTDKQDKPELERRKVQDPAPETGEPIDRTPREDPLSDV